jgi:hypothetical protein
MRDRHVLDWLLRRAARARHPGPASGQLSHVAGATRAVTVESFQPMGEIGIIAAKSALHHDRSDVGSLLRVAEPG